MGTDDRHGLCVAARVRGELTVHELWLRYFSLGGNQDEFHIDGYLQGVLPLDSLEQDILAVALNERLDELYRAARVPIRSSVPDTATRGTPSQVIEDLLHGDGWWSRTAEEAD